MFSKGNASVSLKDILDKVTEGEILSYYLNIYEIPTFINSPLREDKKPSFGLYSPDGKRIFYVDLSTGDRGGVFDLLGHLWSLKYMDVLKKVHKDIEKMNHKIFVNSTIPNKIISISNISKTDLKVKTRPWKEWDIEYWKSYGITKKWLEYAEVYPVSQIFIIKEGITKSYSADKLAYVYVEHKENKVTLKVYQPKNTLGYKWTNKHDRSVISLWTKIPEYGDKVCICSSLKDALCLWANTNIPALAIQGEGYGISNTAINELKRRYKKIYILLDNDDAGLKDGEKLSISTGFINLVLPKIGDAKDISDLYKHLQDKKQFKTILLNLFNN